MDFKTFEVTCRKCKGHDTLKITRDNQVFYTNHTPIIAARFRPDMRWGFECTCGNDSRLAYEEKHSIGVLVSGAAPATLEQITADLKPKNEDRFAMETV